MKRHFNTILTSVLILGSLTWLFLSNGDDNDENVLNLYTTRQAFLIEPVTRAFREETGITIKTIYAKTGLVERLKLEGKQGQADVILASDASIMKPLVDADLLIPLAASITSLVDEKYRAGSKWVGVTKRLRVPLVAVRADGNPAIASYEDLTRGEFKGRLCMRSGKHPYNVTLVSAMMVTKGEDFARQWLQSIKNNLARKPQGNDRAQARATAEGICDASIMNSYYLGKMRHSKDERERKWAEKVRLVFPDASQGGAYGSVSAVAMAASSSHRKHAEAFIRFLLSTKGQRLFADENYEYPVRDDVAPSQEVLSWGSFFESESDYATIYAHRADALRLIDDIGFDH